MRKSLANAKGWKGLHEGNNAKDGSKVLSSALGKHRGEKERASPSPAVVIVTRDAARQLGHALFPRRAGLREEAGPGTKALVETRTAPEPRWEPEIGERARNLPMGGGCRGVFSLVHTMSGGIFHGEPT